MHLQALQFVPEQKVHLFQGRMASCCRPCFCEPGGSPDHLWENSPGNVGICQQFVGRALLEIGLPRVVAEDFRDGRKPVADDQLKYKQAGWPAALVDYNKAVELKPDFAVAYYNRGIARQAKGDRAGAVADFNKAIDLKIFDSEVYKSRGHAKSKNGDLEGAITDYDRAIAIKTNDAEAYMFLGEAEEGKNDFDAALADLTKSISLQPNAVSEWPHQK